MKKRVATIGTFDGVHLGHKAVVSTLLEYAGARDMDPLVVTFDRHPLEIVAPERAPKRIISLREEVELLRRLGVDVAIETFNEHTRMLTAREWLAELRRRHGVEAVVIGYDNTFGCDGINKSIADYKVLGMELGISVEAAPRVPDISSSRIRRLVADGEVEKAAEALGRPFRIEGLVVQGRELGRRLGFPTANVDVEKERLLPARGVYSAVALLPDGSRRPAVVNIGVRPTVAEGLAPTVEAHILDWKGNLYGSRLILEMRRRLRPEQKFDTLDDLKAQIAADCRKAREEL